jgi:hypothetical protein
MGDESFGPGSALARIEQARGAIRDGRRLRCRTYLAVGALTIGYFALMGWVRDASAGVPGVVLTLFPTLAVLAVADVWNRRRAPESRRSVRRQFRLAVWYAPLTCAAAVAAILLPHPLPAALVGLAPAVPCFLGAWWAVRR